MSESTNSTIVAASAVPDAMSEDATRHVDAAEHIYSKQSAMLQLWWDATDLRPLETRSDETALDRYVIGANLAIGPSWVPRGIHSLLHLADTWQTTAPVDPVLMAAFCVRLDTFEEIHRDVFLPTIDADTGAVIAPTEVQQLTTELMVQEGRYMAQNVAPTTT